MLGSFYEKAWDFERQAQAQRHFVTPPLFTSKTERTKKQRNSFKRMHLPKSEMLQLGGGGGGSHYRSKSAESNGSVKHSVQHCMSTSDETACADEVSTTFPKDRCRESIFESVIAGWILLVFRYQRDSFHNFTWGFEGCEKPRIQCIPTVELDLQIIRTISDLLAVVRKSITRDIVVDYATIPTLIFNDGTKEEVFKSAEWIFVQLIMPTVVISSLSQVSIRPPTYNIAMAVTDDVKAPSNGSAPCPLPHS